MAGITDVTAALLVNTERLDGLRIHRSAQSLNDSLFNFIYSSAAMSLSMADGAVWGP